MRQKLRNYTLADEAVPGHCEIGNIGSITKAAKDWARNNPDPTGMWARRRNKPKARKP